MGTWGVTKPIKQGEFGACLAAALGLDKIAAAPVRKDALFIPGKLEGRARHRLLVVEDNLVNLEVVIGMLEWTPCRRRKVASARPRGVPTLGTKWKGRSAAEVCTSEARKIGQTACAREGSALLGD
jgi:hypothetical protein